MQHPCNAIGRLEKSYYCCPFTTTRFMWIWHLIPLQAEGQNNNNNKETAPIVIQMQCIDSIYNIVISFTQYYILYTTTTVAHTYNKLVSVWVCLSLRRNDLWESNTICLLPWYICLFYQNKAWEKKPVFKRWRHLYTIYFVRGWGCSRPHNDALPLMLFKQFFWQRELCVYSTLWHCCKHISLSSLHCQQKNLNWFKFTFIQQCIWINSYTTISGFFLGV